MEIRMKLNLKKVEQKNNIGAAKRNVTQRG